VDNTNSKTLILQIGHQHSSLKSNYGYDAYHNGRSKNRQDKCHAQTKFLKWQIRQSYIKKQTNTTTVNWLS